MSNFGERIYELRNKNNMSQGALADKLDVSRQTISKWENSMCMPETEKLIQLSDIFDVSTDYILKGEENSAEPVYVYVQDPNIQNSSKHSEQIVRKYVGMVLSVVFSIATIALLIIGGEILAIIPGAVAILGILLVKNVKHPWLITSWIVYVVFVASAPFFSVLSPFLIFDPIIYTEGYTAHFLIGYGLWLTLGVLIICTIKAKRGFIFKKYKK